MQHAQIAQLVEQRTENPCVAGSIPALGTFLLPKLHNENDGLLQIYICRQFFRIISNLKPTRISTVCPCA